MRDVTASPFSNGLSAAASDANGMTAGHCIDGIAALNSLDSVHWSRFLSWGVLFGDGDGDGHLYERAWASLYFHRDGFSIAFCIGFSRYSFHFYFISSLSQFACTTLNSVRPPRISKSRVFSERSKTGTREPRETISSWN